MRNDQIFTPKPIVEKMLDMVGYAGENIRTKTIFEPSFGDGAFLTSIVQRAINFYKENNLTEREFIEILDRIYGVEIDKKYFDKTIDKLDEMLAYEGFVGYDWSNLHNSDALDFKPDIEFDMAVINPPYIRVQDLDLENRKKVSANYKYWRGNSDMYVVFFEMCMKKMAVDGKMCFITPNSYFKNSSQKEFREYLIANNLVEEIIDFGTFKVFDKISTYAAITLFNMNKEKSSTLYTSMKDINTPDYTVSVELSKFGSAPWTVTNSNDADFLKEIEGRDTSLGELCSVQFGIATNADSVYIIEPDDTKKFEADILRPVVKASTLCTTNYIVFPYRWDNGRYVPIPKHEIERLYPKATHYFESNKNILLNRSMERSECLYYEYGRTQGIQNSRNKKIALKNILAPGGNTCEFLELDANTLVYSGLYIVANNEDHYKTIIETLRSEDFHRYLMLIGKDMSGGYKSFNAKAVKQYRINMRREEENA